MQIGKVMPTQGAMVQGVGNGSAAGEEFVDLLQLLLGGEAAKQGQNFLEEQPLEMAAEAEPGVDLEQPKEIIGGEFNLYMTYPVYEQRETAADIITTDTSTILDREAQPLTKQLAVNQLLQYPVQPTVDTKVANLSLPNEIQPLAQDQNNRQQGIPAVAQQQQQDASVETVQPPQMGIPTNLATPTDILQQTEVYRATEQDASQVTVIKPVVDLTAEASMIDQEAYQAVNQVELLKQKFDANISGRPSSVPTPTTIVTPEIEQLLQKDIDAPDITQNAAPIKDLPGSQMVTEEIIASGSLLRDQSQLALDDQPTIKQGEVAKTQEQELAKVNQIPLEKPIPVFGKQTPSGFESNQQNSNMADEQQVTEVSLPKGTSQKETDFPAPQELSQQIPTKPLEQSNMVHTLPREVPVSQLNAKLTEMVKAMMIQQDPGQTTLKMKLQPEQLGEVTVQLTWSKGELSAQFITATGAAKEALESSFPQLKELLAQQNIRLSEAAVFMGQQTGQWEQRSFDQRDEWQFASKGKSKAGYTSRQVTLETEVQPTQLAAKSGVNLVV